MIARSVLGKMSTVGLRSALFRQISFRERMENRNLDKQKENFSKELNFMASKPSYTLQDFKQRNIDGITQSKKGLMAKFMSGNDQSEAQLNSQLKLLNAMFENELQNPEKIGGSSQSYKLKSKRTSRRWLSAK